MRVREGDVADSSQDTSAKFFRNHLHPLISSNPGQDVAENSGDHLQTSLTHLRHYDLNRISIEKDPWDIRKCPTDEVQIESVPTVELYEIVSLVTGSRSAEGADDELQLFSAQLVALIRIVRIRL